jgi:hypothetical protein
MSVVSIVNQALSLLAVDPIISLSDDTKQANVASRIYAGVRDHVLDERAWTFATGRAVLTPEGTTPAFGFSHQFSIPTTWLRILSVTDILPVLGSGEFTRIFEWRREGDFILGDAEKIYVSYTEVVTDTSKMSSSFKDCLAYRLAADMAIPLRESRALMIDYQTIYSDKLIKASSVDAAQGSRERKYVGTLVTQR